MKTLKKNILITCAGGSGPIYLAKKLKNQFNVFLVDGDNQNVGPHLGFPFAQIPFGKHPHFLRQIDKLVKQWKIDYLVPGADEELLPISTYTQKNTKVIPIIPSYDFIKLALNKKQLMQKLAELNISYLLPFKSPTAIKYPAFAKPNFGRGSRQTHILNSPAQLKGYLALYQCRFSEILVQPYIPGEEYTVSIITNNLNKLIGIVPKKVICKKGITRAAVVKKNSLIEKTCQKIVELLQPAGPCNAQLMLLDNQLYIFEINPRLSTTTVLTDKAWGNEVELFIKFYNQKKILRPPKMKTNIFLYRYEENIFK